MKTVKTHQGTAYSRHVTLLLSALVVVLLIALGAAPASALASLPGHSVTPISIDPTNLYGTNISALAVAANGTLYAVHDDGYVYKVVNGAVTGQLATGLAGYNDSLALSPDGTTLYVGIDAYNPYGDGRLGIVLPVNTTAWTVGTPIVSGAGWVNALAVSPTNGTLYVAGPDKDVHEVVSGAVTGSVTLAHSADSLAISPDGSTLYVGDASYGDVGVVTPVATSSMTAATAITTGAGWVNALAVSPDGTKLYVAGPDGEVIPVATATATVGTAMPTGEANPGIGALAVSPDGTTIYAGAAGSGKVYPIAAATSTVGSPIATSATAIKSLATADGIAYAGGNDGYVYEIINTYTLTYTAGAHGSITGTSPQTVNYGADGSAVTAVPATGYHFTGWSDSVATATRHDTDVTADVTVTASFAWTKLTTKLTITSDRTTAHRGQMVTFSGTISPSMANGTHVIVEIRKSGSSTWSTLATRGTYGSGHWSYAYKISLTHSRGTFHVRVRFAGNAKYRGSVSASTRLVIK